MYPFEANMPELTSRYENPDHTMMIVMAVRIRDSVTGTYYSHRKNDEDYEALLYMAAAMLLGKIGNSKLSTMFVEHDMLMYANEANTFKNDALIMFADGRYGLGINMSEIPHSISLPGYLRCIPKDDMWDLTDQNLAHGRVQTSFEDLNKLASIIIGNEVAKKFQKASYHDEIDDDIIEIITDELYKQNPHHLITTAIPPCMFYCQRTLEKGEHLPYNGRFALAAFHGKRGMNPDDITSLFRNVPDYKESVTRMHIGNILDKNLMPYSCDKMEQYGLCKRHERCNEIKNPLSYK